MVWYKVTWYGKWHGIGMSGVWYGFSIPWCHGIGMELIYHPRMGTLKVPLIKELMYLIGTQKWVTELSVEGRDEEKTHSSE